eukprot:m.92772 g.92772  ORF g.92772 m.92772 type:complete len:659 (+) comp14963_c0_seq1:261-2237(+)
MRPELHSKRRHSRQTARRLFIHYMIPCISVGVLGLVSWACWTRTANLGVVALDHLILSPRQRTALQIAHLKATVQKQKIATQDCPRFGVLQDPYFPRYGGESCFLAEYATAADAVVFRDSEHGRIQLAHIAKLKTVVKTFASIEMAERYHLLFWGRHVTPGIPLQAYKNQSWAAEGLGQELRAIIWDPIAQAADIPVASRQDPTVAATKRVVLAFQRDRAFVFVEVIGITQARSELLGVDLVAKIAQELLLGLPPAIPSHPAQLVATGRGWLQQQATWVWSWFGVVDVELLQWLLGSLLAIVAVKQTGPKALTKCQDLASSLPSLQLKQTTANKSRESSPKVSTRVEKHQSRGVPSAAGPATMSTTQTSSSSLSTVVAVSTTSKTAQPSLKVGKTKPKVTPSAASTASSTSTSTAPLAASTSFASHVAKVQESSATVTIRRRRRRKDSGNGSSPPVSPDRHTSSVDWEVVGQPRLKNATSTVSTQPSSPEDNPSAPALLSEPALRVVSSPHSDSSDTSSLPGLSKAAKRRRRKLLRDKAMTVAPDSEHSSGPSLSSTTCPSPRIAQLQAAISAPPFAPGPAPIYHPLNHLVGAYCPNLPSEQVHAINGMYGYPHAVTELVSDVVASEHQSLAVPVHVMYYDYACVHASQMSDGQPVSQ